MLAKTLALFAIAASLVAAAPTPDWNGHHGHKHHGHGGWRHGGWRQSSSSEVATPTDDSSDNWSQPSPSASPVADNSDNSDNSAADSNNLAAAPPANSAAAPPANSGAQPSGQTFTGPATFYNVLDPSENEGQSAGSVACSSQKYNNDDFIVAINSAQYPGSCGKTVVIKDTTTGNTATATAVDECSSCEQYGIDLTPALWNQLHNGNTNDGIFTATWSFQ
ncbi:hypothetical protein VHUM_01277 [Vanrija humicola]|uniref:Barwin domain-containing protein n=1 Tax=Vanrija humicola TaxID=5417 RepID=A0A7D8Z7J2_VANHU|nr:hypothetical protein VHUM_01277 [Vanrija humicola]